MSAPKTLTEAQDRFIRRVNTCHPGHRNRVKRSAWKEMHRWLKSHGVADEGLRQQVTRDAWDMAELERICEE